MCAELSLTYCNLRSQATAVAYRFKKTFKAYYYYFFKSYLQQDFSHLKRFLFTRWFLPF
uniref:Uncharacterized protein n=1 Tax=Anguilla anguilla TaxID=7936 RepID=A0A0E9XB88_ANGAN